MAIAAALWGVSAPTDAGQRARPAAPSCGRECLSDVADGYFQALLKRDPRGLPWAAKPKFTENNVALPVGDGLWGTIDGFGPNVLKVTDPQTGTVAWFGVVRERDILSFWGGRMKVVGGRIGEVETVVVRKAHQNGGPWSDPARLTFDPIYLQPIPAAKRLTRAKLMALAEGYFDTLQKNNGTLHTRFAAACARQENGQLTAGDPDPKSGRNHMFCGPQFEPGYFAWDDRVRDRRFTLVDPEHGLVLASVFIDHSGKTTEITLRDGTKTKPPKMAPDTAHVLELFKVDADGAILRAETVLSAVPYRAPSPWTQDGAPTTHRLASYGRP